MKFFYNTLEERRKLIFPEEVIIPKVAWGVFMNNPYNMVCEEKDNELQFGPTWFLDQLADTTGVREDMMRMFNDDRELVNQILTYAYYLFSLKPRPDISVWQQFVWAPVKSLLDTPRLISILEVIKHEHRMDKFRCLGIDEAFLPPVLEGRNLSGYGMLFVCFVFKILCSCLKTVWSRNKELKEEFEYPEDIGDKFRPVHCFMRKGEIISITPLKEEQFHLCRIFGLCPPKFN